MPEGITLGGTMRELTHLPLVDREANRWQGNKADLEVKRTIAAEKKARATALYREWYLDLPEAQRPNKVTTVYKEIADTLSREFHCPVSASIVRQRYLKNPKTSDNG